MGLSFLKRKKKNKDTSLLHHHHEQEQEEFDIATTSGASIKNDDHSVSRFAVLQSATNSYDASLFYPEFHPELSSVTPTKESRDNDSDGTPTTVAQTPSPTHKMRVVITPPDTQDDTPLISNQLSALEKDVNSFLRMEMEDDENEDGLPRSKLSLEMQEGGPPGLSPGKEKKSRKKKKKKKKSSKKDKQSQSVEQATKKTTAPVSPARVKNALRFLQPSKKDTVPISPALNMQEEREPLMIDESQYHSNILLEYDDWDSREAGVELELSLGNTGSTVPDGYDYCDSDDAGNVCYDDVDDNDGSNNVLGNSTTTAGAVGSSNASGSEEIGSLASYINSLGKIVDEIANEGDIVDSTLPLNTNPNNTNPNPNNTNPPPPNTNPRISRDADSPAEPKFLSRLRKIGGTRGINVPNTHDAAITPEAVTPKQTNLLPHTFPNPIPEFINNDEEASMPSMLTEPEIKKKRARMMTPPPSILRTSSQPRPISPRTTMTSITNRTSRDESTYFGRTTATGGFMSSASRAGGIEKLLGVFQCGEDTTLGTCGRVRNVLTCGRVEDAGKEGVELGLGEEEEFALEFQSDIIKNGVKLIYHESPSRSSTSPDWIQSTVKLFLRPGNCHNGPRSLQQPTITWAVLPVVSRMQIVGSFDSSEEAKWSHLGLLDVHSILIDENSENCSQDGGSAPPITGFFSVTAADGAVYVFEAPSAKQRDYVVTGLRAVIARLTYHMVAGNADVIGEMFSEDAGQVTGELPSLVSPWKALGRVTHAFLDRL